MAIFGALCAKQTFALGGIIKTTFEQSIEKLAFVRSQIPKIQFNTIRKYYKLTNDTIKENVDESNNIQELILFCLAKYQVRAKRTPSRHLMF